MQISKTEFVSKIKSYSSNCVRCREGLKMSLAYYFQPSFGVHQVSSESPCSITTHSMTDKQLKNKVKYCFGQKCCTTLSLVVLSLTNISLLLALDLFRRNNFDILTNVWFLLLWSTSNSI